MAEKTIGYKRTYRMRKLVPKSRYISVGLPFEVVEREAAVRGMSVDSFIATYVVVAEYDNFDGVRYTFEKVVDHDTNG